VYRKPVGSDLIVGSHHLTTVFGTGVVPGLSSGSCGGIQARRTQCEIAEGDLTATR